MKYLNITVILKVCHLEAWIVCRRTFAVGHRLPVASVKSDLQLP